MQRPTITETTRSGSCIYCDTPAHGLTPRGSFVCLDYVACIKREVAGPYRFIEPDGSVTIEGSVRR